MHPFWAVPRVSALEVQKSQATSEKLAINMELRTKRYQSVLVGNWKDTPVKSVFAVDVPFLVNPLPLQKGEQLHWESASKKETSKRELGWKDAVNEKAKKAKLKPDPKPKPCGDHHGVSSLSEI